MKALGEARRRSPRGLTEARLDPEARLHCGAARPDARLDPEDHRLSLGWPSALVAGAEMETSP